MAMTHTACKHLHCAWLAQQMVACVLISRILRQGQVLSEPPSRQLVQPGQKEGNSSPSSRKSLIARAAQPVQVCNK